MNKIMIEKFRIKTDDYTCKYIHENFKILSLAYFDLEIEWIHADKKYWIVKSDNHLIVCNNTCIFFDYNFNKQTLIINNLTKKELKIVSKCFKIFQIKITADFWLYFIKNKKQLKKLQPNTLFNFIAKNPDLSKLNTLKNTSILEKLAKKIKL